VLGKRGAVGTFVLAAGLVIAPVSETPAAADTTTGTSAQIVTPTAGSAVTGLVDVEATGQVDPTDGFAQSMQLLVDGTALPQSYGCSNPASPGNTTSPYSCQVVIPWDATGLSGSHTLQAALTTNVNTVDSPSVTVTVNNPRPTVALDSPAPGVVAGLVALKASGSLPGGQTDVVQQIQYWIDGALVSTLACINPECPTTYYWNTVGHTGAHTVEVKLLTRNGSVAAGPVENFQVVRPIQVTVDFPNAVTAGTSTSITGHVTATDIDSPAAGVTVKVTFTPATGSPSTVATTTAANGTFRVSYTPRTKTTISATVIGTNVWQASSTDMTTLLQVDAVVPCALSHSTVQHGRSDTLTCQASGMPSGTRADVQERVSAGKWVLLTAAGHFSGGKVKYTFTLKKKGSYTLAVLIGNNTVYSGGYGQTHVKVT
jgi:hypothetical protein